MKETETFTGMIIKKHRSFFGKCYLTLSDTQRTRKVECHPGLFNSFCEGIQLTIVRYGNQLVSWRPASSRAETHATAIEESTGYSHGKALYYRSSRCMNTLELQECNQGLFTGEEIVSFDCSLFEHLPVQHDEIEVPYPEYQYLGIIVEPAAQPSAKITQDGRFTFCGYDLVEETTQISAITNCGAAYSDAINYAALNSFGLISSYADAKYTQQQLRHAYPNEEHANCVIVEIWRYIADS